MRQYLLGLLIVAAVPLAGQFAPFSETTPTPAPTKVSTIKEAVVRLSTNKKGPFVKGDRFTVNANVTQCPEHLIPINAFMEIHFPSDVVSIVGQSAGDLGGPMIGPVQTRNGSDFRKLVTMSNPTNPIQKAKIVRLDFEVMTDRPTTFTVELRPAPKSSAPLMAANEKGPIPHRYDNSATTDLVVKGEEASP